MKSNSIQRLCVIAVIAALYTAVSLALAPLTFGNIQIRIAEALTLLPVLFFDSVNALVLGCALTNLLGAMMGVNVLGFLDVFFGTFATLIAALLTWKLKKIKFFNLPILSACMPVLLNGIIIGAELSLALFPLSQFYYGWLICGIEVAIGEVAACFILGIPLICALEKKDFVKRFGLH